MDQLDAGFSKLFVVPPPTMGRTLTGGSHISGLRKGELQRRPSIKHRICGVFQSSKQSRNPSPEPSGSVRKRHQQVDSSSAQIVKRADLENETPNSGTRSSIRPVYTRAYTSPSLGQPPKAPCAATLVAAQDLPIAIYRSRSRASLSPQEQPHNLPAAPRSRADSSPARGRILRIPPSLDTRDMSPASSLRYAFSQRLSNLPVHVSEPPRSARISAASPPVSRASRFVSSLLKNHQIVESSSATTSGHDSKYSSSSSSHGSGVMDSTPRTSACSAETLNICKRIAAAEFAQLESIARRLERRLNQHFEQCQQLAANLVRLSSKQTHSLTRAEHLLASVGGSYSRSAVTAKKTLILATKDRVRSLFLRKAAVMETSVCALSSVKKILLQAKSDHDASGYMVEMEPIHKLRVQVNEDIPTLRSLDAELSLMLEGLLSNSKFRIAPRDAMESLSFGPFIEARLGLIEETYCKMEALGQRIEVLGF